MNKRCAARFILIFTGLLSFMAFAQEVEITLEGDYINNYHKAVDLNEGRDYLEAYRAILQADRGLDSAATADILPRLGEYDFQCVYWPIKKTRGEVAYMLGLHTDMENVVGQLKTSLASRMRNDSPEEEARYAGMLADILKIEGSRYYLIEEYDSAEISLKKSALLKPFDSSFIGAVYGDLAQLYYRQGLFDKALTYIDSLLDNGSFRPDSRLSDKALGRSEVLSQRAICLARLARFDEALETIDPIVALFRESNDKRLYAEALRKKAKILMLQSEATGRYNPRAKECYLDYLDISRDYIDNHFLSLNESEREQYWMAERPFVADCYRLEEAAPELLFDVALYSKAILLHLGRQFKPGMDECSRQHVLSSMRRNWHDIKDALPASGCAIEFIAYDKAQRPQLAAVVVTSSSDAPRFIRITDSDSICSHEVLPGISVRDALADTHSKDKINALYSDSALRRIIWNDALREAIAGCDTVFFAPDGIFHQLGIEYLTPPDISDKSMFRLTSTRLLAEDKRRIRTDGMLICGAVGYEGNQLDNEPGNDALAYSLLAPMSLKIDSLPNSAVEIDSIVALRTRHHADRILRADSVTESALINLMSKYHIVHISTHGLFAEIDKAGVDIHPSSSDTQLSKSCLFLSASQSSLDTPLYDASRHDGILSAREIAKMELGEVDLTVMSACMSGLGYITPDGVFGLQRGLKAAGVKSIISTLWSIDDEASSYFIIRLYDNLEAGQSLHEAFGNARKALMKFKKTYGIPSGRTLTIPKFNKPYFYNAFILIDALE